YAFTYSLVLVGYAVLGFCGLYLLWLLCKRRLWDHKWFLMGWITLLCCYVAVNYELLLQIFGVGRQRKSHKEIILRSGKNILKSFCTVFYKGTLHTPTHQQVIVLFSVVVLLVGLILYKQLDGRKLVAYHFLVSGFCFNIFCALFYALYQSEFVAQWRNQIGGVVKEFQIDRIYWLSVSVWYILLGLSLYLAWEWIGQWREERNRIATTAGIVCMMLALCASAATTFYYSDLNKNLHRLRLGEAYKQMTWRDFYAPDVFSQIDNFIGREKSSYRTLSFGICPAAPLYNGFYCLDGYSNNYDLSYLYQFRKIIEGELRKDASLKQYYDAWGCRCYVLSAELGINNYLIAKGSNTAIHELSINVVCAKEMGAKYLFSALRIPNAQELGIKLMREEPFETADSYYSIYLYEL
ncbi:MAG: hypothetical protein K2G51_12260, partial [Lachnospiraceae bacterium]|nr:hypothetical protein [Lachnospiraceae bacterium]